jgi:intein/homing endonuclease
VTDTTPDHTLRPLSPDAPAENGSRNGSPNGSVSGSAEKHGSLFGGALTEEVLGSSRRVLSKARGNENVTVGLQQWFSPPEAARLIAGVFNDRYGSPGAVLDPTAGAGALLGPFPAGKRFGIEIDADHVPPPGADPDEDGLSGRVFYRGIRGDAQKVVPMLRAAGVRFPAIVLNPPFGLGWRDAVHANGNAEKEINSTALAYLWALDLLKQFGQGAMICGTDRLAKEILSRPEGRGVYAIADVRGPLFDGVALPTSIAFFVRPDDLKNGLPVLPRGLREAQAPAVLPARFSAARKDLPDLADAITAARDTRANYVSNYAKLEEIVEGFHAVEREHDRRRRAARSKKAPADHDVSLRGRKVSVGLSAYTRLALSNVGRLREVELLKNNHVSYFAQNKRAWRQLESLEREGLISISPALRGAATKAVEEAETLATPLFPVRKQMRLGWLADQDRITCIKGDPKYGFVAGESYPLSTRSKVASETQKRVVENRRGEHELMRFTTERKLLEVTVGSHVFDEGNENIRFLTDHFDFPDPGCVATRFPDLVRDRRALLRHIERKNGFELKLFQLDHLSRLLVRGRGMLAHEQGLGKCVGGATDVLINGFLVRAEDAWKRFASDDRRFDGEGEWAKPTEPLATTALAKDGRTVSARISSLYRQKVSEWGRRVTLDDGSTLTITDRHKLHGADDWTLDVKPGDRVAVPRRIVWEGTPEDPEVVELLAWQIAEGHELPNVGRLTVTQKDRDRLERLRGLARSIGDRYGLNMHSLPIKTPPGKSPFLGINSRPYRTWLKREFGYDWGRKSARKRIPDRVVAANDATVRVFLRAFLAAEGSVNAAMRVVEVSSASRELMDQLSLMLRRFGIWLRIADKRKRATNGAGIVRTYYAGLIGGESLRRLAELVGIDDPRKAARLKEVAAKPSNTNVGGVPVADVLQEARSATGLPWLHLTPSRAYAFGPGGASPAAAENIAARLRAAARKEAAEHWRGPKGQPPKPSTVAAYRDLDREALVGLAEKIEERARREVHYARVVSVERVRLEGFVYDFEVSEHHNYTASGMLAHNTLMLMTLAEAHRYLGAKPQALFVSPQDLGAQWAREAKRFFGRRLEVIRTPGEARRVADRVRAGEAGWWWTYFEALSVVGRKKEPLPHRPLKPEHDLHQRLVSFKRKQRVLRGEDPTTVPSAPHYPTTRDACPECGLDTAQGWTGEVCGGTDEAQGCGYVHRRLYVKSAYSHLTTAFEDGVTCVDEISEIRGEDSLRSKAVRALGRGPHKYGATGTPLSNFLADAYYPIGWSLGFGTPQFPYDHAAGRAKFEADFCTVEHMHGREEDGEENVKKRRKILPQICNVSQFWRLAQPSISRCRKEQTGEPLVERTYYPIRVPMGVAQQEMHAFWMDHFPSYFRWKDPNHAFVQRGLVERYAATLGLLWRLEHASTLPAADEPSLEWPVAAAELTELSNFTPATLKVLEIAMSHAENGEKVLVGSDLIRTGLFLSERLNEKGVRSVHITEERAGKVGTKNPRKRAREVEAFAKGDAQVLCAGVGAMKLGHDLHAASTVIVLGLPYSFMVLDQFLARVHRLSSPKPVSVYVVIPNGSLAVDKWELLKDKGGASDLAFDGELSVQPEEAIDWNEVLRNMKARGIQAAGNEVPEAEVEAAWREVAPLKPTFAPRPVRRRPPGSPGLLSGPQPVYGQPSLFDVPA